MQTQTHRSPYMFTKNPIIVYYLNFSIICFLCFAYTKITKEWNPNSASVGLHVFDLYLTQKCGFKTSAHNKYILQYIWVLRHNFISTLCTVVAGQIVRQKMFIQKSIIITWHVNWIFVLLKYHSKLIWKYHTILMKIF